MRLSPVFSAGMVLQRDSPGRVWGHGDPGSLVRVTLDHASGTAEVDASGHWRLDLPAHAAGGPYVLRATSTDRSGAEGEEILVEDVLFGDVWILAGQSNMQLGMGRLKDRYQDEVDHVDDDRIRFFRVPESVSFRGPLDDVQGGFWEVVGRDGLTDVSGVGFFFARAIRRDRDVPLGLIQVAIGGTPIETWMSGPRLEGLGYLGAGAADRPAPEDIAAFRRSEDEADEAYRRDVDRADRGLAGDWFAPDYDDSGWDGLDLDRAWRVHDALADPGVVWMRCRVDIPAPYQGHPARLNLGTLVDADECYVDGRLVGSTGYRYPPRSYPIDRLGAQVQITVRLHIDTDLGGGWTPGKHRSLAITDMDRAEVDLDTKGLWSYRRGVCAPPAPVRHFPSRLPSSCFNAMVAPLGGMPICGVLWYQGESNASRTAVGYARKFMGLIQDWRTLFGRPDLPFIYVQLPNLCIEGQQWPRLRDEQRKALVLDQTAMVVACDLGEDNDLHPLDKKHVGERLAYAAQAMVYGADHQAMGPDISHAERREEGIILHFTGAGSGLVVQGPLTFDLVDAGSGHGPQTVQGAIASPDTVLIPVDSDRVLGDPVFVRYAWAHSPRVPLANVEGLLVSPFEIPLDQAVHAA